MKYTLHDGKYIHSSGYSNREDATRIAGERNLTVIEHNVAFNTHEHVVDGQVIRKATQSERDAHPSNVPTSAKSAINARLRDDRDNRGRDGKLSDIINDILQVMDLDNR